MPIEPVNLPSTSRGDVVADKTSCRSCGYNLQGLLPGGNCPECGAVIAVRRSSAKGDNLTDAPAAFLRRYAALSGLTAWVGLAAILLALGGYVVAGWMFGVLAFLAGVVFAGLVVLLTKPRPMSANTVRDVVLDDVRWRQSVRLGVVAWPLLAFASVLHAVAAGNGWSVRPVLGFLEGVTAMAAFAGTVPLLIHLASMAAWAGDTGLASRLRGSAWILTLGTPMIVLITGLEMIGPQSINGLVNIIRLGLLVVYVFALLVGVFGMVQMAVNAVAAVRTNAAQHARDQRIAKRRAQEMASTVERQFSAPEPVDPLAQVRNEDISENKPRIGQGPRIEQASDAEAYELEPDDPAPPPSGGRV